MCPEVPSDCHKINCDKDSQYIIKCEKCPSYYEEGTPLPMCGYTTPKTCEEKRKEIKFVIQEQGG